MHVAEVMIKLYTANLFLRDCLAAPGTTVTDGAGTGTVGNPNKNKTCYKCQQEGHVSNLLDMLAVQ